jgi:CRP/FNR family cyclic AMP-dependent transcriptional regulator
MATSKAAPAELLEKAAIRSSVKALARRGALYRYRKDVLLIQEGDIGDTIFIIVHGRLMAFTSSPEDDREFHYGTYGVGDYVGEMGLDGGPRSASVKVLEPTVCAVITRRTLEQHIAENPSFAFEVIDRVIARARDASHKAQMMALKNVDARVRWLLDSLAQRQADGSRLIGKRPTHEEMASRIGCVREMVGRVLKNLEREGLISETANGKGLLLGGPLDAGGGY